MGNERVKIRILGCGASGGVPMVGRGWGRCNPDNPKNRRLRTSALIRSEGQTILIDTSPDLRAQLLSAQVERIDALLYTHAHADHLHGIDDLRSINRVMQKAIPTYANEHTMFEIKERFKYIFKDDDGFLHPLLTPHVLNAEDSFHVGNVRVHSFTQEHGSIETLGFRVGDIAYTTDVNRFKGNAASFLKNLKVWIVGAMTELPVPTHASLEEIKAWTEEFKPEQVYLTHMSPQLDYDALCKILPGNIRPAHDGLEIEA